jgi:CHAT domain-containing protein
VQAELVLARLSGEILKPAAPYLRARRLLIVADGGLLYVPFAALPLPGGGGPLVVRHEVVHLDSPSVLAMQRELLAGRPPAPLEIAVVADPVFSVEDPRLHGNAAGAQPVLVADLRRSADDLGLKGFRRLPESGREAAALLALAPRRKSLEATGFAATRRMVLQGTLSRYKIVHIATHGLIHPTHPELSGLVLSLVDEQGRPQDGFLRSYELQEMDLPADLVVLSACQTALGKEVPGEGLVGLTRGLMRAGARRLVVSLWSVEDTSTAELMGRFYQSMLRQGMSPSAALREAQLSMLRDPRWSDPRHWAPFIFQGDWH